MKLVALLLLVLGAAPAWADDPAPVGSRAEALAQVRRRVEALDALAAREAAPPALLDEARRLDLALAEAVAGAPLDLEALRAVRDPGRAPTLGGWLSFVHVVWAVASLLVVVAGGWLVARHLLPWLHEASPRLLEALLWLLCGGLVVGAGWCPVEARSWVALLGCLGSIGAAAYSHARRGHDRTREPLVRWSALLCVAWGAAAAAHESRLLALLSVLAYMTALGFSVVVSPLCVFVGFRRRSAIPAAMGAALVLTVTFSAASITGARVPWLGAYVPIFEPAASFVGTFVWFLGGLIVCSRHHRSPNAWAVQGLFLASAAAALLVGSVWGLPYLEKVAGTFFALWLIEKYLELPWRRGHWPWVALGLGALLWGGAWWAARHPTLFFGFGP